MGASSSVLQNDEKFLPDEFSKEEMKSLIGEEFFTEALFNRLRDSKTNTVPKSVLLEHIAIATDCFLTHDWGIDELKRNNHHRVSVINTLLKEKGLRTWFDEEAMKGDIQQQMGDGIDNCGCVIIFVTLRYMEKVAGKGEKKELDNCYFEFSHAAQTKGRGKMIVVVMEPRCQDTGGWFGKVGQNLSGLLYVNYSTDEDVPRVANEIYTKVVQTLKEPIATRIENYITRRKSEQLAATASSSANNEDELRHFFENEVGCSSQKAMSYSSLLHNGGVETKKKLQIRCKRDETYLVSLGIHAEDVADILFLLLGNDQSPHPQPSTVQQLPLTLPSTDSEIEDVYRDIRNGKKEKLKILEELISKNNSPAAKFCLGMCYFQGHGVSKDLSQAVKLYQEAADAGHVMAQFNLGICYLKGEGVKRDLSKAVAIFTTAAEKDNNPKAQFQLGNCYYNGRGVTKNEEIAKNWYRKAAEQGYVEAQYTLGTLTVNITDFSKDESLTWFRLAADQGYAKAQHRLGAICHGSRHFTDEQKKLLSMDKQTIDHNVLQTGIKWYLLAAEQGFANAQNSLGIVYYTGSGVEKDYVEAAKWFRKAAEQNHPEAQEFLAKCYMEGHGVTQNYQEALYWCKKAAPVAGRLEAVVLQEKIEKLMK